MFRTANAARLHVAAPLTVAAAFMSYASSEAHERYAKTQQPFCQCEATFSSNDEQATMPTSTTSTCTSTKGPFRVLVVGSGLTGCLTALRIRQRANYRPPNARPVEVTVVERATYPAGRFGATATYRGCIADIGAQVLSTINPHDHRALGGHGVEVKDIKIADQLVQRLTSQAVLVKARDDMLGETEERMLWEGLWKHYFAPAGMVSVLQKLLDWAGVKPIFGVRIDSIDIQKSKGAVLVKGIARHHTQTQTKAYSESYDYVVLCIPAPDVLEVSGLRHCLSKDSRHVLENVGYDQRTCEAHFFSSEIREDLTKAFEDRVELMVEGVDEKIQYISWQNQKSSFGASHDNNATVALVVHGQTGQLHPLGDSLDQTLAGLLTGKSEKEIASHRLYSKSIPWRTSQMITPMEAVVADPPSPAWQCIVERDRRLIIAGDFMTQSSFLGCVASADAAGRAVIESTACSKRRSGSLPS